MRARADVEVTAVARLLFIASVTVAVALPLLGSRGRRNHRIYAGSRRCPASKRTMLALAGCLWFDTKSRLA
jgi:hypothetical protein